MLGFTDFLLLTFAGLFILWNVTLLLIVYWI